jgi:hypothetical protein
MSACATRLGAGISSEKPPAHRLKLSVSGRGRRDEAAWIPTRSLHEKARRVVGEALASFPT